MTGGLKVKGNVSLETRETSGLGLIMSIITQIMLAVCLSFFALFPDSQLTIPCANNTQTKLDAVLKVCHQAVVV